ncbi:hypothetical protein ACP275_08G142900 [Erythranthe tilingii]
MPSFRHFLFFNLHFMMLVSTIDAGPENKIKRPFNNSISAIFVFGDSTVDSGNNNYVHTPFRSNFPPYGTDFVNRIPTGRYSDGRLVTDFIASYVGIKEYVPPYLDPKLRVDELMTGVCFAFGGSGFDPLTSQLLGVNSIQKQLEYFKEYKRKLETAIGKERTKTLISKAAFIISAGTNDFVVNYFGTPFRRRNYDIATYQQFLLQNVLQFIQGLREEGARLIAVVGLPPIGCMPIVITVTSGEANGQRRCIDSLSTVALDYNQKLQNKLTAMDNSSSSAIYYADIYQPLNDMIQNPSQFGFENVNCGCCGSGLVETTFMCNSRSSVCENPSKYVFFDSVHPTEAAYSYLFQALRPIIDRVISISF